MGDIFSEVVLLLQVILLFEEQALDMIGSLLFVVNTFYLFIFKTYFCHSIKGKKKKKTKKQHFKLSSFNYVFEGVIAASLVRLYTVFL